MTRMRPLVRVLLSSLALNKERILHFNHAGASPSPDVVLNRVIQHLQLEQELGGYAAAASVSNELDGVYQAVAELVHAKSDEIALVGSATDAWTRLFYAWAEHVHRERRSQEKMILLSEAEYAANVVAACQWARTHSDWSVSVLPSTKHDDGTSTGVVDVEQLQQILNGETIIDPSCIAMVGITHIPTNSGIVNPVEEIGSQIANYNRQHTSDSSLPRIWYLLDACQSVGQRDVNVVDTKCHGLVATGRKYLRGPRGTGFLYCQRDICDAGWPQQIDHASVPITAVPEPVDGLQPVHDVLEFAPRPGAARFEFWESNIAAKLGLGQAVEKVLEEDLDEIAIRIRGLANSIYEQLGQIDGVRLHHVPASGIVTFWIQGVSSVAIKERLWEPDVDGVRIEVSVVPATSTPFDSARTHVPDLVRASLSYTNTKDDVRVFCSRLSSILESL